MTYLLHYVNPSLWKGQNDQRSAIHACTVNIVLNLTNLEEGKGKYHDIVLNLISYEGWEGRGEGGGATRMTPTPHIFCVITLLIQISWNYYLYFTIVVLSPEGLQKTYFDFSNNTFPIGYVIINFIINFHCIWIVLYYDDVIKKLQWP